MSLYFISGASGSGKSAIIPILKKTLDEKFCIYDFDEIGVPAKADKQWRQEATEKWLQKVLRDDKDICLFGQMVLGEILACPSAEYLSKINFCFLDVRDFERIERLKKRNETTQEMLCWAAWLHMHHQNPHWHPVAIKENCWHSMNWRNWDSLDKWNEKANVKIIDTTGFDLETVAAKVTEWIQEIEGSSIPPLIPYTPYTLHANEKDTFKIIDQRLFEFNKQCVPATQSPEVIDKHFLIKDGDKIIAGIHADIYIWKILFINVIYVEEAYRKQSLGSILLQKVEEEAKLLGAKLSHLDTFDFQSKDFYLQHGYEVFGVLENCPQGHKRYYLKKELN